MRQPNMSSMSRKINGAMVCLATVALLAAARPTPAQELFPQPFLVEHYLVQTDPDGDVFSSEPVIDYYGGSLLISVRGDGRCVYDFINRTITDIQPDRGTYTVLTFDQLYELRYRLWQADLKQVSPALAEEKAKALAEEPGPEPAFTFEKLPAGEGLGDSGEGKSLVQQEGIEHVRVRLAAGEDKSKAQLEALAVDLWFDSGIRMSEAGQEALARFESEVLAALDSREVEPALYVTAARRRAKGAVMIRSRKPSSVDAVLAGDASIVEGITTRIEPLQEIPSELAVIPEGCRRVLHRLEQMVTYAEEQAELYQRASELSQ